MYKLFYRFIIKIIKNKYSRLFSLRWNYLETSESAISDFFVDQWARFLNLIYFVVLFLLYMPFNLVIIFMEMLYIIKSKIISIQKKLNMLFQYRMRVVQAIAYNELMKVLCLQFRGKIFICGMNEVGSNPAKHKKVYLERL